MDADLEAAEFVARIRARFPDEAARTDAWLTERVWDAREAPHVWVEAFADRTTDAMRAKDWPRVREHTEFVSEQFRVGSEAVRRMVDVSYSENLMWDLDTATKMEAWPHIAQEVRLLYEDMWGVPSA